MRKITLRITQLLCFIACLCSLNTANATHSMGLDLTYACTGNNTYEVTLTFYRDCNGISAPNAPMVQWTAACGSGSIPMSQQSMVEITPSCPGIVGTACNGGFGIYGIEEYTYVGVVTIPPGCTDVTLSFTHCCRNHAITTLANPGSENIHVETKIGDGDLCNNSPIFTNKPVPFGCIGQPVFYNHGASDPDGDNLVYSFTNCYDDSNMPVTYAPGFSATAPLATTNGINIDANTGAITFTPSIAQVGVLCVLVEEFRNGQKIGEVVRDIQFTAVPCSNNVPVLSGIDNTTNFTATVTAGNQLCFDVFSSDPDSGQTTFLAWNAAIPGATFTSAGTPHAIGTFCWTPTSADVGTHTFTVSVSDDYCPIVGQNTYTYTIIVVNNTPCDSLDVSLVSYNDVSCSGSDGSAVITANNGVAPYTYQVVNWTTNEFFTNTTGIFNNLTPGSYSVWVQDANGCTPACAGHTFDISGNVNPLNATASATDVSCPSNSLNVQDSTNSDGTITVTAVGGTSPYLYSIDGINFQSSDFFDQLAAGTYDVTVLDANGCSVIITVTVGEPAPIQISVVSITPATCGQSNGSITLTATGGDGTFFYYLNGQSQGSNPTFTNLAAGTYTFSVCDMHYCLYDTTITIPGSPAFTATTTGTDPLCNGDCNGTATVTINSTTPIVATVLWSNGATGPTIGNLCAGTYTATITDASGCEATASVTINEPAALSASLSSSTDETCAGNDGTANISVSGGTTPYTINLANFNTSNTYSNATGAFTGLNAGHHVVNVVDANGCRQNCAAHFALGGCGSTLSTVQTGGPTSNANFSPVLRIHPNPASTIVQVSYETQEANTGLTVLDNNGKIIYTKQNLDPRGSVEVEISNWANSSYFVVLQNAEGRVIKTEKLVVSN